MPAFSTPVITATILQNQFRLEANLQSSYRLNQGVIEQDGRISVSGRGERRDISSSWTMQFSGKAVPGHMTLTGNEGWRSPCTILLSNTRPAPYSLAGQEIARQQQLAPERRGEAERQAAAGRPQRERSAKEQAAEAQLQQLRADAEIAKQKAVEFDKKLTDQTDKQQSADAQLQQLRADAETAKQRADEAEKELAELRAAPTTDREATQKTLQAANDSLNILLNEMVLPPDQDPNDWVRILWKAAIPIQQQQFCRIMNRFYPNLEQINQTNNEIRRNLLYQERQKDFETLLPSGRFENWVLRVLKVEQADDGNAAILLQAPCRVMFGSDICKKQKSDVKATIKTDSPMFRELTKVARNDFVVTSGTIVLLTHENDKRESPQYAVYKPGEYCSESDNGKKEEVIVAELHYLVKLLAPIGETRDPSR